MVTVNAQVEADVERRAAEILQREGLTVADAVRRLLEHVASEGAVPPELTADEGADPAYDAWFRAKVQEALDDKRPRISAEEVERRMAGRRAAARGTLRQAC